MRIRTIGLLAAALLLGAFLLGCTGAVQIARNDAQTISAEPGRLIGALITTEPLDLFDIEGYLNDHAGKLLSGGVIDMEESTGYEGRLYAVLTDKGRPEYTFEGVDGIRYFAAEMEDEHGSYTQSVSDEGISDGHTAVNASEDATSVSLEGTVYISSRKVGEPVIYFINPVYQEADGRVYAMEGNSVSFDDDTGYDVGGKMTVTLNESNSQTVGDKSTSRESSVKISIAYIELPERITIVQMDGENTPLDRKEYRPGEVPEALTVAADAKYLIVVTINADGTTSRALYQKEDESFTTLSSREDGICVQSWTEILWPEN